MNCDDPDFEAFESNLCAIIWARVLCKTAALAPILAQTHQTLNHWLVYLAKIVLN